MSERRFFVVTMTGEIGPFTVEDLRRELAAGGIQPQDHVRTAMGAAMGTVVEIATPLRARSSGRLANVPVPPPPTPSRGHTPGHSKRMRAVAAPPPGPSAALRNGLLAGGAVLLAALIAILSVRREPAEGAAATPSDATAEVPRLRIEVVQGTADYLARDNGTVRIIADRPPIDDLPLALQISGTADFRERDVLPHDPVLKAGATTADLLIVPKPGGVDGRQPRDVIIQLRATAAYGLGSPATGTVVLRSAAEHAAGIRDAPAVPAPAAPLTYRALLPTSEATAQVWRYTTSAPERDWNQRGFGDAAWPQARGGFGQGPIASTTPWRTADIWLRKTFAAGSLTPDRLDNLTFRCAHDDGVEVFINGIRAYANHGYTSGYEYVPLDADARRAIRPDGDNLIAVHCHQISGRQFIDIGIYEPVPGR